MQGSFLNVMYGEFVVENSIAEDSDFRNTLLFISTKSWIHLLDYQYNLIYGYKKQLFTINLTFNAEDFFHLAGFHYLDDLALPHYNSKNLIKKIMSGVLIQAQIEKSRNYNEMVLPRLQALSSLENVLNGDFKLFSFRPEMYSTFRTSINAKYLIQSSLNGITYVFLFGEKSKEKIQNCFCRSIFVGGQRNYTENQRMFTLLKKSRIQIKRKEETVLFIRDGFIDNKDSNEL